MGRRVMLLSTGASNLDLLIFSIVDGFDNLQVETKFFQVLSLAGHPPVFASCDSTVNGCFVRMRGLSCPNGITLGVLRLNIVIRHEQHDSNSEGLGRYDRWAAMTRYEQ